MDKASGYTVLGFLGTTLDAGQGQERWNRWRPTLSVCQQEDLLVTRLVLLTPPKSELAEVLRQDVAAVSPETQVELHDFAVRNAWDFEEVYAALHDFARRFPFDPDRERYLVHLTTGTHVAQICLFLLCESRHLPAQLLQSAPPKRRGDELRGSYYIVDLDLSRYDRLATRFAGESKDAVTHLKSGIETRNPSFNQQMELIERVALSTREPILLMGPMGAGKSQLAKRIAELKKQRHKLEGPFVELNCATLRGDQAMAALFGHTKGAFTGAVGARAGLLMSANHGLLFLDEIGELGRDEQAMLLRALEEKRFLPVGADREEHSDFQLIAGTNQDLVALVGEGRFREDLLARINLWTFRLPCLKDRLEDLEPNLDYELERFAHHSGRRVHFNRESRERYLEFATSPDSEWSGNFRDLNASVLRMATLAPGGRITVDIVSQEIQRLRDTWRPARAKSLTNDPNESMLRGILGASSAEIDRFDWVQLLEVVRVCRRSRSLSDAGRLLFQASRGRRKSVNDADRLRKYLARFGLRFEEVCSVES